MEERDSRAGPILMSTMWAKPALVMFWWATEAWRGENSRVVRCPVVGRPLSSHCEFMSVPIFVYSFSFSFLMILIFIFSSIVWKILGVLS